MSTAKRVIKNTIWLYIRMAASIFVNIFTTRILLQALGASDYGLYNVVGGSIAMLGFLTASMSTATQRFINYTQGQGDKSKVKEIFNNAQIVHYGIAAASTILLTVAALVFFNGMLNIPQGMENTAIWVYVCVVFSTVFSITIVPFDSLLNAHENMRFYSIAGITDVLFKLAIAMIVLYVDTNRLLLYAILMAAESWLLRFITKIYCIYHYEECRRRELRKYYNWAIIREMISFAGWNMANLATLMLSIFGINLVINHFFGTELNAALGVATQLSGVLMGVSMNMIKAITPVLVKAEGGHDRHKMLEISYVGCKFSYLLFSFFCTPVLFYIKPILKLWLQEVPAWTTTFCQLMLISALIDQITVSLFQSLQAEGNIKQYSAMKSVINVLPIFASIGMFSIWNFPPYWALINLIIGKGILGGIINLYFCRRNIGLSITKFIKTTINPCIIISLLSILLGYILINLKLFWTINLTIFFIASVPIYWYAGLENRERAIVINLILKRN